MNNVISKNWEQNQIPGIDCLTKADGTVVLLNCFSNEEGQPYSFPFCETTVESLLKYDEDVFTEIQTFVEIESEQKNFKFIAGEGRMGNEGFIAQIAADNNLIWALFFEHSNPFKKLEIHGEKLHAFSTAGHIYIVDITEPENVDIENA